MDHLSYKTHFLRKEDVQKKWFLIDASGKSLGRLSSQVANIIRGKHKVFFSPHVDCGDNVVIINADKIALSGNKEEGKLYIRHTGYPGGQRIKSARQLRTQKPTFLVQDAVRCMLPKNRLGRKLLSNLHVFSGGEHDKMAQSPETINLKY